MRKLFNISYSLLCFFSIALCAMLVACEEEEGNISASEVAAAFVAPDQGIQTGAPVSFEDQSTGDVTHWSWAFEGGTPAISHEQNPAVTYKEAGTFEVKLVVSNARHTNKVVKSVEVTAAPQPVTADFTVDKPSALTGENVTFSDASTGNATEWAWEFIPEAGDAITSQDQNPVVVFDEPGVYSVKLTISNSKYSDEVLKEDFITIIDATAVAAEFSSDAQQIYAGQEVSFEDRSVGTATTWEWTFEGGTPATSTEQNPVVTYSVAGNYKVTLVASNDSKSSTIEKTGYIKVIPGSGLLAFLPFSGDNEDKGPLSLGVTSDASVSFGGTDRAGNPNASAVFDGTGIVKINSSDNKQLVSNYTVGIWMKTSSPQEMWVWEEGGKDNPLAWFRINNNSTTRIYSFLPNLGGILNVSVDDGVMPLSDDVWHHVVCTRDAAGTAKIYVDGALVKERTLTIEDLTNNLGFILGGQDNGPDNIINYYTGQLDDLVIYDRVLSESEISMLSGF